MIDCTEQRRHMVECQLRPGGIIEPQIIEAFETVPREVFLPEDKRGYAYIDQDFPCAKDKYMIEPLVHARLLQAALPTQDDVVLNIGDYNGYASAILSGLATTIVTLEKNPSDFDIARKVWADYDFCNIVVVAGSPKIGAPEYGPYSLVLIHGSTPEIPYGLSEQIAVGGRLACVIKEPGQSVGRIIVKEKINDTEFAERVYQDAATPYIVGLEPEPAFQF